MDAIRLTEPGRLEPFDAGEPAAPGTGEALVRVHRVGICGTDYHAFAGRQPFFAYPRILGHELAVEVEAVGAEVTAVRPGDRCAVLPYLECGRCTACRRGRPNCCADLRVLGVHVDGGMRTRFVVPAAKLHPSPRATLDELALVETLAIGAHAVARAAPEPGDLALVLGVGPIGLAVAEALRARGVRVLVCDRSPTRLRIAESFGFTEGVPAGDAAVTGVERLLGELPHLVFDATGNAASMNGALRFAAPAGRVVFVGLHPGEVTFEDALFHRREITLLASRNACAAEFRAVLEAFDADLIDARAWITHRTDLERVCADLPRWADPAGGVVKALVHLS